MCGICFTIRQRLWLRRRQTSGITSNGATPACPCTAQHAASANASPVARCDGATVHGGVPAEQLAHGVTWHTIESCGGPATMRIAPIECNGKGQLQTTSTAGDAMTGATQASAAPDLFARLVDNVQHRGPDTSGVTRRVLPVEGCGEGNAVRGGVTEVQAAAAVLGLRGSTPVRQPYEVDMATEEAGLGGGVAAAALKPDGAGHSFLMWNGEIFDGVLCPPPWGSDTVVLARRLLRIECECASACRLTGADSAPQEARQALFLSRCVQVFENELEGPYGFLYYAATLKMIVFGRDPLGRHSLLTHLSFFVSESGGDRDDGGSIDVEFIVSSVGVQHAVQRTGEAAVHGTSDSSSSNTVAAANAVGEAVDEHGACLAKGTSERITAEPHDTSTSDATGAPFNMPVGAKKRPRSLTCDDDGDDDNGEEDGDGAAASGGVPCWSELPVTGLFAVPLHRQLTTPAEASEPSEWVMRVMLHCPWRRTQYRVHPLLRTAVAWEAAAARGRLSEGASPTCCNVGENGNESVKGTQRDAVLGVAKMCRSISGDGTSHALTDIAVTETASWERGFYLQKDMTPPPQLPRALVARVQASVPLSDAEDDVWAHWAAVRYLYALSAAVHRRIDVTRSGADDSRDAAKLHQARRRPLCILFSGGIDCTVLAALAHYLLPPETPIELANVAFGAHPEQAPDRVAALRAMDELLRLPQQPYSEVDVGEDQCPDNPTCPSATLDRHCRRRGGGNAPWEREWRLVLIDVPHKLSEDTPRILDLLTPRHTVLDLDIGTALWSAARGVGRMQVLRRSDLVVETDTVGKDAAASLTLADFSKHFRVHPATAGSREAMRGVNATASTASGEGEKNGTRVGCGDEMATGETKFDLLVEVMVKEGRQGGGPEAPVLLSTLGKEYGVFLQPHIARFGYKKLGSYLNDATHAGVIAFAPNAPSKAVCLVRPVDRERAAAMPPTRWLRTRAMGGVAVVPPEGQYATHYVSGAKVMLLGMGADETLGGYTRYRRFFHRHGMSGARRELEKDFARLWLRNLGRDDRITMDSGREPRFPYLDEGVLRTLEYIVAERYMSVRTPTTPVSPTPTEGQTASFGTALADDVLQKSIEPVISFRMNPGEGDKRILRNVAVMLGLGSVTRLQKRAIQFGSRAAERRVKGTTVL